MRQPRNGGEFAELPVAERLAEYTERSDGCLVWQRSTNHFGHGHLKVHGRLKLAHRVAWELAHGPIPAGMIVRHLCDNPGCIEISHLQLGTHRDNAADKVAHRRLRNGRAPMLNDETVRAIRRDWALGKSHQTELAQRFGTSREVVAMIVTNHTYRHLLKVF